MSKQIINIKIGLLMVAVMLGLNSYGQGVLPMPTSTKKNIGSFSFSSATIIVAPSFLAPEKKVLETLLKSEFQLTLGHAGNRAAEVVSLSYDPSLLGELGKEGYVLKVSPGNLVVAGATSAGIFYGIQSLRQLITKSADGNLSVSSVEIRDRPRFARRMFMLDEGRHFKGMAVVKEILDEMALLKMNTFHWHLTEDQGWRIEIKKYPLLTSIGGYRDSTENSGWGAKHKTFLLAGHGGFYTQKEIKEIVAYAASLHIEVIPEIDMPGHSTAAIAAYPWLSASDKKVGVAANWGVLPNAYNVADARVMGFLRDVLEEVMELFPSKIIHIGGDEVDYSSWKGSKGVQDFIGERKLSSVADLQRWFTGEMAAFLRSKGRRLMGWNDIMGEKLLDHFNTDKGDYTVSGKLDRDAIVHFWLGKEELLIKAVRDGHQVVNAFHKNTYFNYGYDEISLEQAYDFEPVPAGLSVDEAKMVIGTSCQLWSEYVPDVRTLNHQLYPRLAASAEVGWSEPGKKDYGSFLSRLGYFAARWKKMGIVMGPLK